MCLRLKTVLIPPTPRGRGSIYTNIDGAPRRISREVPKAPEFSPFSGKSLGALRHFHKANFTSFKIMFPLRGMGLLRKAFPCVFGWERYLCLETPRGSVRIDSHVAEEDF